MSLESFIGLDKGEGMSESAFEALREKMKAAQAQIQAIRKEEKKKKKKEEELLKILLKFIKTSHKKDLVLLISRVLEINVPANFILAIILLGNEEIQREVGNFLMLKSGGEQEGHASAIPEERSLVFFSKQDDSLPLKLKIEMDNWMKSMLLQAEEYPQKLLKTAYKTEFKDEEEVKTLQKPLIQLCTYIVRDYLDEHKITESFEKLQKFSKFILKGILTKTEETLRDRQYLETNEQTTY